MFFLGDNLSWQSKISAVFRYHLDLHISLKMNSFIRVSQLGEWQVQTYKWSHSFKWSCRYPVTSPPISDYIPLEWNPNSMTISRRPTYLAPACSLLLSHLLSPLSMGPSYPGLPSVPCACQFLSLHITVSLHVPLPSREPSGWFVLIGDSISLERHCQTTGSNSQNTRLYYAVVFLPS